MTNIKLELSNNWILSIGNKDFIISELSNLGLDPEPHQFIFKSIGDTNYAFAMIGDRELTPELVDRILGLIKVVGYEIQFSDFYKILDKLK